MTQQQNRSEETTTIRVLLCTAPPEEAETLAETLVGERLCACVNLVPGLRSIYRWQGAIERATETLLLCKTSTELVPRLLERLRVLHPYEVPEVLALPVVSGNPDYLAWVLAETAAGNRSRTS